jgi:hypothetical protein
MLVAAAGGDRPRAVELAGRATDLAGGTQDRLLQTVVSVMAETTLGTGAPAGPRLPGVPAEGWAAVARLALGAASLSSTQPGSLT